MIYHLMKAKPFYVVQNAIELFIGNEPHTKDNV